MKNKLALGLMLASCCLFSCKKDIPTNVNADQQLMYPGKNSSKTMAWETVLDASSFSSYNSFESQWNYLYPWGSDHNGTARMYASSTDHNHVYLSGGVLTIKATRINWNEGNSTSQPYLPIRYHSGAVNTKHRVLITDQYPQYEVKGDFQAPSASGTWPAFWLTGVNSWPPESDILEFKGDNRNWFNTFRTSSDVSSTIVPVSSPGNWHNYRVWINKVNATDVDIHYYLDGTWKAVHRANFVNKPMYVIINLQMEGSSGSPGPTSDTYYRAKNIYIGRSKAF
jgi:hypothetical protein